MPPGYSTVWRPFLSSLALTGPGASLLGAFDIFIPFGSLLSTSKWLPLWIWLQPPQPGDLTGELQPLCRVLHRAHAVGGAGRAAPGLGTGFKCELGTYSGNYVFLPRRMLGLAVTEDRLPPSTFVHSETTITPAQLCTLEARQLEAPWSPPPGQLCQPHGCPRSRPGLSLGSLPKLSSGAGRSVPAGASPCEGETEDLMCLASSHAGSTPGAGTAWAPAPCQPMQGSHSPVL